VLTLDAGIQLDDADHVVQLYESEDDLISVVCGYLGGALVDGESVVVIATAAHRDAFRAALSEANVNVDSVVAQRRLLMLDAAELLTRFMVDGAPDPSLFDATVGDVLRQVADRGRPVRAYGEMVALLWEEGSVVAAVELEQLWNSLGERLPFALFCAYPARLVADETTVDMLAEVCDLHSEVVARAPRPKSADVVRRFPRTPNSSRFARQFVTDVLQSWGCQELVEDAALVVSELATNAMAHAGSDFTVSLVASGSVVRLIVGDASPTGPIYQKAAVDAVNGRGLSLVQDLSLGWGHEPVAGGKLVWIDIGLPGRTGRSV
jgi:anti-sigma regulatory factor (Ser/Thr protein kinase)